MNDHSSALFGTDGIRAVYGEEPLTEAGILRIGGALADVLLQVAASGGARAPRRVLVGRDTRASGPDILALLNRGIAARAFEVVDLGVIPTPGVAYLVKDIGAAAGVVISASHNPARYNGIKVFGPDGFKLADELETAVERNFRHSPPPSGDSLTTAPVAPPRNAEHYLDVYKRHLLAAASGNAGQPAGSALAGMRLVVDGGRGAAARIAPEVFRALGATVIEVACEPDGTRINEGCGALHPETLRERVREARAYGGVTFDGDADRVLCVTEDGAVLDGDYLLALLARKLLAEGNLPGKRVVGTVMANIGLELSLREIGVELLRAPVGDKYVVAEMLRGGYILGGEQSGHILCLRQGSTTGDGVLSAVMVLLHLAKSGQPLSAALRLMEKLPQILLNVEVRDKPPLESLTGVQAAVREAERALAGAGRVVLRYSGTEPLARVMIEGRAPALVETHARAIAEALRRAIGIGD